MNPAHRIIDKLGGFDIVAEIAGCHVSRVYRWTYPRDRGGTGGSIPGSHVGKLLGYARAHSIDLSAEEFFAVPEEAPE